MSGNREKGEKGRVPVWVLGCSVAAGLLGLVAVGLMAVVALNAVRASRNASELPPPPPLEEPETLEMYNIPMDGSVDAPAPEGGAKLRLSRGKISTPGADVSGGEVSNATRVVAGMRAGFRRCYERKLETNPNAKGTATLTLQIGPNGEVSSVSSTQTRELDSVAACCKARAMAAQFDPPTGGAAQIVFPIHFELRE